MIKSKKIIIQKSALLIAMFSMLTACGGSGGGDGGAGNTSVNVAGTVSAPGGAVAFNKPSLMNRMFASIIGGNAHAGFSGVVNVGAGVTVQLIEVDSSGTQVGNVLAEAATESRWHVYYRSSSRFYARPAICRARIWHLRNH